MASAWGIMIVFGLATMFLLGGTVILFLVSFIYHMAAKRKKKKAEKPVESRIKTLSKAA